jgi:MoxR-like ATPase
MIQISMGYPEHDKEVDIIMRHGKEDSWKGFSPVVEPSEILAWQKLVDSVTIHEDVVNYIVYLIRKTRSYPGVITGASPRSGIKMSRLARALALVRGQDFVTIDLVKELALPVFSHRLELEDPTASTETLLHDVMTELRV